VREVTAYTVADGMRRRTDALRRVILVVWDEAVLATEVARLLDITNRLAMLGIVTLLVSRLA
jgi:hypothetical protein